MLERNLELQDEILSRYEALSKDGATSEGNIFSNSTEWPK